MDNTPATSHSNTSYTLIVPTEPLDSYRPSSPRPRRNTTGTFNSSPTLDELREEKVHIGSISATGSDSPHFVPCAPERRPSRTAAYISIQEYYARIRGTDPLKLSLSKLDEESLPLPTVSPTTSRNDLSALLAKAASRSDSPQPLPSSFLSGLARFCSCQSFWLGSYFFLNLFLTLHNKFVLVSFPYPYTLTAVHALCGSLGGGLLMRKGLYTPKRLREGDYIVLVAFSLLYSINIAISNVSLRLVTVPVSPCHLYSLASV